MSSTARFIKTLGANDDSLDGSLNESGTLRTAPTTVSEDDDFTIHLQHGPDWDKKRPQCEILYSDVADFKELVKVSCMMFGLDPDPKGWGVVIQVAYMVSDPEMLIFHEEEWVLNDEEGEDAHGHSQYVVYDVTEGEQLPQWVHRYVQDQKGWNAVVYSAKRAVKAGKRFCGIHLKVEAEVCGIEGKMRPERVLEFY